MGAGASARAKPGPAVVTVSPKPRAAAPWDARDEPEPEASPPLSQPTREAGRSPGPGAGAGAGAAGARVSARAQPAGHAAAGAAAGGRPSHARASGGDADAANKELEGLLLQTNWSAIYQLFHQRFGIAELGRLDRGYVVKSAAEMTFSIVAKCFALLRSDPHGRLHCTPLHIAALQSSTEAAEVIIRDLPQLVEQTHRSSHTALCPLHIAILSGAHGMVELLLEGKANPNVRTLHDVCPMHLAATTSKELCEMLLSYKAVPTHRDVMGSNAVHYAAAFKQHPAMELLLGQSQISQRLATDADQKRITPLHISCALYTAEQDLAGPMALLASGAKPWQADISGATPPELVPPKSNSALQRFFEACGNRPQSAAQKWVEDQILGRNAAETSDAAEEESMDANSREPAAPTTAPETEKREAGLGGAMASRCLEQQALENERVAEIERLRQELADCRDELVAMESLRRDLAHSREKCAMLEQAAANQQKVFEDLQALCDSARSQHQAQLEEMQRRHGADRKDWEERARARLQEAREEAARDAARQLERQERDFDARHEELRARLSAPRSPRAPEAPGPPAAPAAEAGPAAAAAPGPPEPPPPAAEAGGPEGAGGAAEGGAAGAAPGSGGGGELRRRAAELEEEVARLGAAGERERAACERLRGELRELGAAVRALCARHALLRRPEEGGDGPEEAGGLLERVEAELQRLRGALGDGEREAKEAQEQLRREQEVAAGLRAAGAEAADRHAALALQFEEAKNKHSAHSLQLETRVKDAEIGASQAVEKAQADVEAYRRRAETMESYSKQLQPTVDRLSEQLRILEVQFQEEQGLRKRYHNQIQDMKGAIRVFCRCRPLGKRELQAGDTCALRKVDAFTVELSRSAPHSESRPFAFDAVFDGDCTQQEIFADCRELVQSAVDGYNVTIFAYGQTGAGKTHTMYGSEDDPGLAPRSIHSLFDVIRKEQQRGSKTFNVKAYMVEVYKQDIIDLLSDKPGKVKSLDVRRDLGHGMTYVDGATERQVSSPQDLTAAMAEGARRRHVTATRMNSSSSRSHLLFSIIIECLNKDTEQRMYGKITLCDLAGSERPKKSEVIGDALKEAIEINKSLTALGDVIEALTKGSKSVPYRNHKLTMLMQDSLGGSAKTLMFVNCSPASSNVEETQMSLKWACRARQVTNDVKRNADSKEVARLKQVIKMMSQAQSAQEEPGDKGAQDTAALRAGMGLLAAP